jgi:uncharacterized repeat protein (TIGR02543 family)
MLVGCGDNNDDKKPSDVICTVIVYTGIGNEFNVPMQEVHMGETARRPINFPTRYYEEATDKTYQFVGWYSDPSRTEEFLWKFETDEVQSNMTLYALWEEI